MSLPELSKSGTAGKGTALFAGALNLASSASAELPRISANFSQQQQHQKQHQQHQQHQQQPSHNLQTQGSGLMMAMGGITSGSSLLNNSHSQLNASQSAGVLPPGWTVAQHSVNGKKYFYNEDSKEATWNRPAYTRGKQELYQLRPEHRSLLDEQPSDKLESLPSVEGYIKPTDISRALESVTMSELELATKLRTIGPGLYLAKIIFDRTRNWFDRWAQWTKDTIEDRETRYLRNVVCCQAQCRGWLTRGKAERYRQLLWRQSRMKIGEIRKEIVRFLVTETNKEQQRDYYNGQEGDFKRWYERWQSKQYDFHFEEIIGYKRILAMEKEKRKKVHTRHRK